MGMGEREEDQKQSCLASLVSDDDFIKLNQALVYLYTNNFIITTKAPLIIKTFDWCGVGVETENRSIGIRNSVKMRKKIL